MVGALDLVWVGWVCEPDSLRNTEILEFTLSLRVDVKVRNWDIQSSQACNSNLGISR